jgi:YebC/PmpR family DNA-binding regulatory protein
MVSGGAFLLKFMVAKRSQSPIIRLSGLPGGRSFVRRQACEATYGFSVTPRGFATEASSQTLRHRSCVLHPSYLTHYSKFSRMAGHNKWSKVKHIKARVDARKGKVFSRFSQEISIAARDGGSDPDLNPRLRTAIEGAKSQSMPKDNIERAIKKGAGELGGEAIQEITYEGYGPGGIAIMVEVATDNTNRSAAKVREIFTKNGGSIATPGSVSYQFDRKGEVRISAKGNSEETVLETVMEAGADDLQSDPEEHVVYCAASRLNEVATALDKAGMTPVFRQLVSVPQNPSIIEDVTAAKQALRLYELLDDYQDTMDVFTNFEISDQVLATLDA